MIELWARDPSLAVVLTPGRPAIVWDGAGRPAWVSPQAAGFAADLPLDGSGALDETVPAAERLRALAGGLAPRDASRLEKLRFSRSALVPFATCACRLLALPSGEEVLLTAFVGALPRLPARTPAPAVETLDIETPAPEPVPEPPVAAAPEAGEGNPDALPVETVAGLEIEAPEPAGEPVAPFAEPPPPADPIAGLRERGTLRFLWQADAGGRFLSVSDALAEIVGSWSADIVGRRWSELADRVEDASGIVAEHFARAETWSGRTVLWRIGGTDHAVPVDLAGLPLRDRDRSLLGFRGFGLIRTAGIVERPRALPVAPDETSAAHAVDDAATVIPDEPSEVPAVAEANDGVPAAPAASGEPIEVQDAPADDMPVPAQEAPVETDADEASGVGEPILDVPSEAAPELVDRSDPEATLDPAIEPAHPSEADPSEPGEPETGSPEVAQAQAVAPAVEPAPPEPANDIGAEPAVFADMGTRAGGTLAGTWSASIVAVSAAPSPPAERAPEEAFIQPETAVEAAAADLSAPRDEAEAASSEDVTPEAAPAAAVEVPAPTLAPEEVPPALDASGEPEAVIAGGESPGSNRLVAADEAPAVADEALPALAAGAPAAADDPVPVAAEAAALEPVEPAPAVTVVDAPPPASAPPAPPTVSVVETPARDAAGAALRLSKAERNAFREIARALGARFDDEEPGADAAPEPEAAAEPEPAGLPALEPSATQVLARLPIGVLVHRGETLLFANRALLDLLGYEDTAGFLDDGGPARLFRGRAGLLARAEVDTPAPVPLAARSGETFAAEIRHAAVDWDGEPAALMLVRRVPDADPGFRLKALEAELRAREGKVRELSSILDTATDGVVVVDDVGRILSLNRSAEALFGFEQNEVAGEPVLTLLAPESHVTALDYLEGLRANGVASLLNDGREVLGRVRQGGAIPLFMTMGRVSDGLERKFCAVLRDITAFKKAEGELLAAKRAAEDASSQKSDFLAKISHEIRTPLNAIIGFAEVMLEERFGAVGNERYKDYLRDIHASGEHVISLVNDLLDLAKVEAGRMELSFTSVSLNELVTACVGLMQPEAARSRIVLRTSFAGRLPPVVADERSVRQIVLNLLSNAVKFTDAGGQVIVSTALTDRGEVAFRVRDTGIGMTETEIEAALEPFRQLATARRGGGTGLGLPLTKALVEANRGLLQISSTKSEGTLVEVVFPPTRVLAE